MFKLAKSVLIIIVSVVITSLTIDATTTHSPSSSWWRDLTSGKADELCPKGQVQVSGLLLCIDQYEASIGDGCAIAAPVSTLDTVKNIADEDCLPVSVPGAIPWRYVTKAQAAELCALQGGRLPTNQEWYMAALGTRDGKSCVIEGTNSVAHTGSPECISGSGAYDMIGNVWEFVSDEVIDGNLDGLRVPGEGYVASINNKGVPMETSSTSVPEFHDDYAWFNSQGSQVIMRGGFFSSRSDAGLYSMQANIDLNFAGAGVGFRCVYDPKI